MQSVIISNSMELYYTCKNVALAIAVTFGILSIVYGVRVHIVVIIQKYFGIEKRREIARMGKWESGKLRQSMRAVTAEHGQMKKGIDVSQVKTVKMAPMLDPEDTVVLENSDEGTVVLSAVEDTVVLQEKPKLVMKKTIIEVNGEDIV